MENISMTNTTQSTRVRFVCPQIADRSLTVGVGGAFWGTGLSSFSTGKLSDRDLARMRGTKVGFVFHEYNLLPTLNVLENVMLPLRYVSDGHEGRHRAEDLLERVGLTDRIRHRATELSGGQQQRVAIARSMVNRPSLILLDEPTGAVDTETAQQLVTLLKSLNEEDRVTIVVVTHDLDVAKEAKRQIRLKDGKVVADEAVTPIAVA